jgi:hypothetical protein
MGLLEQNVYNYIKGKANFNRIKHESGIREKEKQE